MATKGRLAKAAEEFEANPCSRESWRAACELATDWFAERDPTPLTEDVLHKFDPNWSACSGVISSFSFWNDDGKGSLRLSRLTVASGHEWMAHCFDTKISTVGELRTLARLVGVELKGRE